MKHLLPLAYFLAIVTLSAGMIPLAAQASDGELSFLAELTGTGGHPGALCDTWDIKWRGPSARSCVAPVIGVYAELVGASANGITGVEFAAEIGPDRLADPSYVLVEIPNPDATTVLGRAFSPPDPPDPTMPRGLNMVWDTCQTGGGTGRVLLETVLVVATASCGPSRKPPKLEISGGAHARPSNDFFQCPLFTLCDAPAFTKVCLGTNIVSCQTQSPPFCPNCSKCSTTGLFTINSTGGGGHCFPSKTVGTNRVAAVVNWSELKELYR